MLDVFTTYFSQIYHLFIKASLYSDRTVYYNKLKMAVRNEFTYWPIKN